jgi:hypothetical protein
MANELLNRPDFVVSDSGLYLQDKPLVFIDIGSHGGS